MQLVGCMVVGKGKIYWFWMIRINIFFLRLQKPACSGVIIFDVAQAACYT